jgi:hypothetical protein
VLLSDSAACPSINSGYRGLPPRIFESSLATLLETVEKSAGAMGRRLATTFDPTQGDSLTGAYHIEASRDHHERVCGSLGPGNLAGCLKFVNDAVESP